MTAPRPTFRVMKNGYDRFAVDDAVERYAAQVDELEKKINLYQEQMEQTNAQLDAMKARYMDMTTHLDARQHAADEIARMSLREANKIIDTAQKNADAIIHEAISTARLILVDLAKIYGDAGNVKAGMKERLEGLIAELDSFELPKVPDLRWLEDAEEKLKR